MITMNLNMISYLLSFSILIGLVVAEFDSNGQVILGKFGKDVSIKFHTTDMHAKVKHRRFDDYNERDVLCNTVTWNSNNCRIERNADENVIEITIFNSSLKDTGIYMLECFNCDHPIQTRNLTLFDSLELDTIISERQLGSIRFIPSVPQSVRMVAKVEGQEICNTISLKNKPRQDSTADATGRWYTINCSPIEEGLIKSGTTVTLLLQVENETVLIDVWNITNSKQSAHGVNDSNQQTGLSTPIAIAIAIAITIAVTIAIIIIVIMFVIKKKKRNRSHGNGQSEDDGQGGRSGQLMLHDADEEFVPMMNGKREDVASCSNGIDTSLEEAKYQNPDHECKSCDGVQTELEEVNEILTPCNTRGFHRDHQVQNQIESSDERQVMDYPSTTHYGHGLQFDLDLYFDIHEESDNLVNVGDSLMFSDEDSTLDIYIEGYNEDILLSIHLSETCVPCLEEYDLNEETTLLETDAAGTYSFTSPDTLVKNPCFEVDQQNGLLCGESHSKISKFNSDDVGSSADVIYMSDRERWLRKVKNKEMEFTNMHEQFKPITTTYEGPKRDVRTFPKGVRGNIKTLDLIRKSPQVTFKTGGKIMCWKKAKLLSQWF